MYGIGRFLVTNRLSRATAYGVSKTYRVVTQGSAALAVDTGAKVRRIASFVFYPIISMMNALFVHIVHPRGITAFFALFAVQLSIFVGWCVCLAEAPKEEVQVVPPGWLEGILGQIIPVPERF